MARTQRLIRWDKALNEYSESDGMVSIIQTLYKPTFFWETEA